MTRRRQGFEAGACQTATAPPIRTVKEYDVRAFLRDVEINMPAFYRQRTSRRKGPIKPRYPNAVKGQGLLGLRREVTTQNTMPCDRCGLSIPEQPEDASYDMLLCDVCLAQWEAQSEPDEAEVVKPTKGLGLLGFKRRVDK